MTMSGANDIGTTHENNTIHFKEWVTVILSVTKTDALLVAIPARDSLVTDSEGCNDLHQANILFKFSRINYRPLVIMDDCSKRCGINTYVLDI